MSLGQVAGAGNAYHLHVHVVPRNRKDGLRGFFWPRAKYEGEAHARETAEAVHNAVARLR